MTRISLRTFLLTMTLVACGQNMPGPAAVTTPGPETATADGVWISHNELIALPLNSAAWSALERQARQPCGGADLANQDSNANVCVLAKALAFARTGTASYQTGVIGALSEVADTGGYRGRALSLGRELAAYVIAADVINLSVVDPPLDQRFRSAIARLLTTGTSDGPGNLVECHENRPNNWGTNCGASRAAVLSYLRDSAGLARVAQVFQGWLGNRSAYAGFEFGDLSWQCNATAPVAINPPGCARDGKSIDGVLPDDQRRAGTFAWPPPKENYV